MTENSCALNQLAEYITSFRVNFLRNWVFMCPKVRWWSFNIIGYIIWKIYLLQKLFNARCWPLQLWRDHVFNVHPHPAINFFHMDRNYRLTRYAECHYSIALCGVFRKPPGIYVRLVNSWPCVFFPITKRYPRLFNLPPFNTCYFNYCSS